MKTTPLHAAHIARKAKMAEFAGYDMPIQYETGVLAEHHWTRGQCGVFDVSHMGQVMMEGVSAGAYLERLTPSSLTTLPIGSAKYTVLTNDHGGIIDDLIITRLEENRYFLVINAGCKDKDIFWMRTHCPSDVNMDVMDTHALLAIQGPMAQRVVKESLDIDASDLDYMRAMSHGPCLLSRLGYTGEDGFELSLPESDVATAWDRLMEHPDVKPIGLAARDSLRLEMGYPLYGHDLNDTTTPIEADLGWIIGRGRAGYFGDGIISAQKTNGAPRKRVGFKLIDKGIAREGAMVFNAKGQKIGDVTSGGFSPSLQQAIAQGYVEYEFAKTGESVFIRVRDRDIAAEITPMPFLPAKTKKSK
jgi:aminomethyltransferase